jgi:hypothetical protein
LAAFSLEKLADCPFSVAIDVAPAILPMLESSEGGVRLPFRAIGLPFPGAFRRAVKLRFQLQPDSAEMGRSHDELAFDWGARSFWLPNFSGVLRFRIDAPKTRLIVSGTYQPPFGGLGEVFDRVVGRRLALATAGDLLDRIAGALENRAAASGDFAPSSG